MSYQILTTTAASITDLKKNPMGTVAEGEGDAVAILNRTGVLLRSTKTLRLLSGTR